ncbi:MAG TPA: hypothetical protein PLZ86_04855 [bacterium]|nr:hypothetical protein [bacterium]
MKSIYRMISAAALAIALMAPASLQAGWYEDLVESWGNPVFTPPSGGSIYYPTVLFDSEGFGGGEAGPFYRAWFSDGSNIGTAESDDGVAWFEGPDCTGLSNPHHARVLYDSKGFGDEDFGPRYRIWYWDTSKLYTVEAIRTAESDDGIDWYDDQPLLQDGAAPIVVGGGSGWNRGSYGPVHLFYQPGKPNFGTDPFDYEYVMYYDGTTGAFEQVGLAFSNDGVFWTRYGDDPVLTCGVDWSVHGAWGSPDPWDSSYAAFGSVIRDSDGIFHFWYSGGTKTVSEGIGYASSDDGIVWQKDESNPFISKSDGTWYSKRAYTPSVLYDENRFSGRGDNSSFKMWFSGRDDANDYHLGYLGRSVELPPEEEPSDDEGDGSNTVFPSEDAESEADGEGSDEVSGAAVAGPDFSYMAGLGGNGGCSLGSGVSHGAPAACAMFCLMALPLLMRRRMRSISSR